MQTGRRKLLLADDSPAIRKVISLTFADEGMEVVAVGDGSQALRLLEDDSPPDIVLADAVMPGPDGYELCERIKRDGRLRHIPVVLLVGTFEPFNEAEARRVGADTVLTKPFQSLRNLVSKVGSLLGGESKREADESAASRRAAEEASIRQSDFGAGIHPPRQEERAQEPADDFRPEPASPFADFRMDDEMIEAKPADSFAAAPQYSTDEETARAESSFDAGGYEPRETDSQETSIYSSAAPEAQPAPAFAGAQHDTGEVQMTDQPAFAAHAASNAAADDALLDLGGIEPPQAEAVTEADDFILDLGEDEPAPAHAARSAGAPETSVFGESEVARADAPGAFAEAAHGESASSLTPFDFSPPAAVHQRDASQEYDATEVVMQDEPQGFVAQDEPGVGEAPRGFVEPTVVPAEEPVPATVESEFTDGNVEGDVPKPPAAGFAPAVEAESASAVSATEPTTEGYAVGEARVGLEESIRPDQLPPEVLDAIVRRVVEMMSDRVVREIAWEVVPELAERLISQRLDEDRRRG